MNTVVIGGLGFLGSATVRELLARGSRVTVMDRRASPSTCAGLFGPGVVNAVAGDARDRDVLLQVLHRTSEVYNFAGAVGTSELDDDPLRAIENNVSSAVAVLDAALECGVEAVFYPSKPNVWLNTYTITKYAAEQFCALYAARGLRVHTLRYFNAYGPGQATGPVRKIIPTFARQAASGADLTVYGDGEQTVDMVYSQDLSRITVDVMRAGTAHDAIDCGRGVALTVNQVAADVAAHFGGRSRIVHVPMRAGETPGTRLVADVAPLERLLGKVCFADWRESLATTLDWYAGMGQ